LFATQVRSLRYTFSGVRECTGLCFLIAANKLAPAKTFKRAMPLGLQTLEG